MKLYNQSHCPDAILSPLLTRAARLAGARSARVIVRVTQGRSGRTTGKAHECSGLYEFTLRRFAGNRKREQPVWSKRRPGKHRRGRCINTDCGYIEIVVPAIAVNTRTIWTTDPLHRAEGMFAVMIHEWGHIRDYQAGGRLRLEFARKGHNGRRGPHDARPEEKRANRYVAEAKEKLAAGTVQSADDDILALAVWLDAQWKKK